jgi:hypothetical protein
MNTSRLTCALAFICSFFIIGCHEPQAPRESLSVSIALPLHGDQRPIEMYGGGTIHVVLTNTTTKPLNVWQEWCSWGWYALKFRCTDANGKSWLIEKRPREWTKNFAAEETLPPGESLVLTAKLADKEIWAGLPPIGSYNSTMTLEAIVEIDPTPECSEKQVWSGRVTSPPLVVTFWP